MNIRIEKSAMESETGKLLWSGALYGMKRLAEMGHDLSFETGELNDEQQQLLQNELIETASFPPGEADLTVSAQDGRLVAGAETATDWVELSRKICFPTRAAAHKRATSETDISIDINLDGTGEADINTGLGFFDHMLEQIAKHGMIDLRLNCKGDLEIDEHHTIEDTAIALGEAITEALGEKTGIQRYAFALPMDESQCRLALDLSGRPYLVFEGDFSREKVGDFPTEMVEHFFYSLAMNMKATIHIQLEGKNDHHKIEACFKAFARCLRAAVSRNERNLNILPSTKDLL